MGLSRCEEALLSGSVFAIALLASVNIFCRSALGFSLAITEELTQFFVILICFVGLSYAAAQGRHIRMTALYDQFSPELQRWIMMCIAITTTLIMATLTYYACRYVYAVFQLGGVYSVTRVPFWVVYAIAPIGLALATIQYAATAFRNLFEDTPYKSPFVPENLPVKDASGPANGEDC